MSIAGGVPPPHGDDDDLGWAVDAQREPAADTRGYEEVRLSLVVVACAQRTACGGA